MRNVFGWVFFRSTDMAQALTMIGHMLLPSFDGLTDVVAEAVTNQRLVILLLALVFYHGWRGGNHRSDRGGQGLQARAHG